MANPRPLYRRSPITQHAPEANAELDREFQKLSDWSISVDLLIGSRPESTFTCPDDDGKLIYYDCASGKDAAAPLKYDPVYPLNPGYPSFIPDADFIFPYDRAIAFQDSTNAAVTGGIGNIPAFPDLLLFVGTADINQWDNLATRRPIGIGGSEVFLDAGTSLQLLLPGVEANQFGYDLQLAPDGSTALAVPLPQPDFSASDTSNDDGTTLISGTGLTPWTIFPDGSDTQPDKLEVTVPDPQEPGDVVMRVKLRVLNTTSNRSGTITIGVGADGALPLPDDQQTFIIPAAFSGALDLAVVFTFSEVTTAPVVMTVWYQGSGDHQQFNLETDNAEGQHQLEVSISRGGGGTQPPITDHQLLDNRFVPGTHRALDISFDDTFNPADVLTGANVQAAIQDHVASKEKRHEASDIYLNDTLMPYDALDNVDAAIQKHVITGSDQDYTDKHPASEISYAPGGTGLASDQVQAAITELKGLIDALGGADQRGWGGWGRFNGAGYSLGSVGSSFVNVRNDTHPSLDGNRNVSIGSNGDITPFFSSDLKVILHADISFRVTSAGEYRFGFRNNLTPAGAIFNNPILVEASIGVTNHVSLSTVGPTGTSAFDWFVAVRKSSGSGTVTIFACTFWMEYE